MLAPAPGTVWRRAVRSAGHEQQVARERHPAADHDLVGVEGVDRVGDPDPEPLAEDPDDVLAVDVALARAVDGVVAGDLVAAGEPPAEERLRVRAGRLEREPVERATRREPLERAGLREVARVARRAAPEVEADHRVAELRRARRAAVELPVQHEPAADAGPDREHDEVLVDDPAAVGRLGQRGARGVVLDVDRQAAALGEQRAQRDVGERQVDRVADAARRHLDDRREPDRDRLRARRRRSRRSGRAAARRARRSSPSASGPGRARGTRRPRAPR